MKTIENNTEGLPEKEENTRKPEFKFDDSVNFDVFPFLDSEIDFEETQTEYDSAADEIELEEAGAYPETQKTTDKEKAEKTVENDEKLLKKRRKTAKFFCAFLSIILLIIGAGYGFVNGMLDRIDEDDSKRPEPVQNEDTSQLDKIYEEEDYKLYSAIKSAGNLNNYVYQWYNWDGGIISSKNVINVLLLGLDDRNALENGGRSDVMMLASLNTKTKKIHLVSFYRDSWVYYQTPEGKEYTGKINGSYFYGGAKCAVSTIENVFKIKIDHYVTVDFNSFQDIVNAVGGVRVDVQEYEAKNMMREWQIECPVGENVLLNGKQVFYFARQRHSDVDADVSRTRRQRQVITAFIESCKGASISQLSAALNEVFGFVKTDLTKNEIMGYATRALVNGWLNYDIEQIVLSDPSIFQTPTINGTSIVVMDYPKVANMIQTEIYGFSNVVLEDDRQKIFNLY